MFHKNFFIEIFFYFLSKFLIFSNLMNVFKFTNKSMGSVVPTLKNFKLIDTSGKRFQQIFTKKKCDKKVTHVTKYLVLFLLVMSNTMVMHISKLKLGKYFEIVSVTKIIATILNVGDVDQESSLRHRHCICLNVDDENAHQHQIVNISFVGKLLH